MLRRFALTATLGLITFPALADTACRQPYVPDIASSSAVTKQDIIAMRDDAKSFIDASDLYQICLGKAAASGVASQRQTDALLEQSQRDKKLVGERVNTAIAAFNAGQRSVKVSDANH